MVRIILATLGGYILILLFLSVYGWFIKEYPERPDEPVSLERIQHQLDHRRAVKALQLFNHLSEPEKVAIKERLKSNLVSMDHWLKDLEQSNFKILCLGEHHEESTRGFLAQEFFAKLELDVLLLEASPEELNGFLKRTEAGRDYFPLLGADILDILRTVRDRNPNIRIHGIEASAEQIKSHHDHWNPRDESIAQNFWVVFESGLRHIILFGALHCTNESDWLFRNLFSKASPELRKEMLNVRVLGEHQNGPMEAFVYFMDEIGVGKRHFVIPDTSSLPNQIYEWFPSLNRQTFGKYRSVVVFR